MVWKYLPKTHPYTYPITIFALVVICILLVVFHKQEPDEQSEPIAGNVYKQQSSSGINIGSVNPAKGNVNIENIQGSKIVIDSQEKPLGSGKVTIIDWGVENNNYYYKTDELLLSFQWEWWDEYFPKTRPVFIRQTQGYPAIYWQCIRKFDRTRSNYRSMCLESAKTPNKKEFDEYWRRADLASYEMCKEEFEKALPELYFDFMGNKAKGYVLTSIDIQTIEFGEVAGGGFIEKEALYDITLSPERGEKRYQIDRKLEFSEQGTGRAILRFHSGNLNEQGFPIEGIYLILIRFNFLVNGVSTVSVSTNPFMIVV